MGPLRWMSFVADLPDLSTDCVPPGIEDAALSCVFSSVGGEMAPMPVKSRK